MSGLKIQGLLLDSLQTLIVHMFVKGSWRQHLGACELYLAASMEDFLGTCAFIMQLLGSNIWLYCHRPNERKLVLRIRSLKNPIAPENRARYLAQILSTQFLDM